MAGIAAALFASVAIVVACGSDDDGVGSTPIADGGGTDGGGPTGDAGGPTGEGGVVPADGIVALGTPRILGIDETHVYWSHWLGGGVFRAPIAGGAVETLVPDEDKTSDGVVVLGPYVYFHSSARPQYAGIYRMPKAGGAYELVEAGGNGQGLAVLEGNVYWPGGGGLRTIGPDGGPISVSDHYPSSPRQFAIAKGELYVQSTGGIRRITLGADGGPADFAVGGNPLGLTADAEHLYWFDVVGKSGGGIETTVRRKRLDSPGVDAGEDAGFGEPLVMVDRVLAPFALSVDATNVYFVYGEGSSPGGYGTLARVPKAGGTKTDLVAKVPGAQDIVLSDVFVFVSGYGTSGIEGDPDRVGRLLRLAK